MDVTGRQGRRNPVLAHKEPLGQRTVTSGRWLNGLGVERRDRQLAAAAVSVRPLAGTGAHHKVHPGLAVWLGHHTWDERASACGAGRERPLDLAGYKIRRAVGGLRGKGHPQFSLRSTLRNWKYQGNLQGARSTELQSKNVIFCDFQAIQRP